MSISLDKNKHIGIIFQPRSGSTILRHYLAEVLNYIDGSELFNHYVLTPEFKIDNGNLSVVRHDGQTFGIMTTSEVIERSYNYINSLDQLSELNYKVVFGVYLQSFMRDCPDLIKSLSLKNNIQFIRLERQDFFYSLLSIAVAKRADISWHNTSQKLEERKIKPFILDQNFIKRKVEDLHFEKNILKKTFETLPIIYYESYEKKPHNIMNLFQNIPKKITGFKINKWKENYRDLIINLDEIESFYNNIISSNLIHE